MLRYLLNIGFACAILKTVQNYFLKEPFGALVVTFVSFFFVGIGLGVPLYWFRKAKAQENSGFELEKIILGIIGISVIYGMLHDQVTARLSPEYYTIGHFDIGIYDPTLLGIAWGIMGTWWVGAILGVFVALACRYGDFPKLTFHDVIKPFLVLLVLMEVVSLSVGYVVFQKAQAGEMKLDNYATMISPDQQVGFLTNWWMNGTSYLLGPLLTLLFCFYLYKKRQKMTEKTSKNGDF